MAIEASKTFELQVPVEDETGREINTITLKRPKFKHIKMLSKFDDEMEGVQTLIADLASISTRTVDEIDIADYMGIQGWIEGFLEVRQATGKSWLAT